MVVSLVLGLSIVLQFTAAALALRLAWISGGRLAWSLIAAAILLMTARRGITFIRMVSGDGAVPPDRGAHDGYLRRYMETGRGRILGIGPRELVARHRDGSPVPVDLAISEMQVGDRKVFIGVVRDISDRKAQEEQLKQAQKMEVVGQLTGGVAHDFNNLLTAIMGNLELLGDHMEPDEKAERYLNVANQAANRGADLTQRLLAFSRRQALSPEPTEINRQVPDAVELMRHTIGEHIEIETVLGAGLWHAMVDPGQLESALLNLAVNARDAMPDGGKLTIETANAWLDRAYAEQHGEVTPGQYVMLAVSDTGSGMSAEIHARAFDPFFTTKEVGKGSGLGLSMVYGFVKQSGGHIKIYTEPGQGTPVKLYLPKTTATGREERAPTEPWRAMPTGRETVLVVEDDPDVRAFVVSALSALGYRILEAEDGPAALEIVADAGAIDLLLTDVVLPRGMNGREVAQQAREP